MQESHGSRTHPGPKCHTRNTMQGLCSGYYQGSLCALRTQWWAPFVGLWQNLCWDVDTQLSCNVLLSSLGGKHCPCQGTPRLVAPHRPCKGTLLPKAMPWWCELQTKWSQGWAGHWWGGSWTQWGLLTSTDMIDHFSGHAWCSGIQ